MAGNYDNGCTTCTGNCDCTPAPTDPVDCPECPPTCDCPEPCPALTAGTFINATITVNGTGCIESITSGSRVIQQRPEPCTNESTASDCECNVDINNSADNLLNAGTASELYARLHTDNTGNVVQLLGNGTAANPLRAVYAPTVTPTFTPTYVNGVAVQTPLVSPIVDTSDTIDINLATTSGVLSANTNGLNFGTAADDYYIVNGLVKNFVVPPIAVTPTVYTASEGVQKVADNFLLNWPEIAPVRSTSLIGVSGGGAYINPTSGIPPVGQSWSFGSISLYGDRVYFMAGANANFYSQGGVLVTTQNNNYVQYATPAMALGVYLNTYSFAII